MIKYKSEVIALVALLLVGIFLFSACQNNVNTTFEDSIEPYIELQAIDDASNATMIVNRGEAKGLDSYFAFEVSNVKPNGLVREGLTEGWCLEWNKPMRQNNDVHSGIEMYNTFGSKTWKHANYLMNIKKELEENDPELTYREIQVALWSLIEEPRFDLDQLLRNGELPSRLMRNGQPNFSVNKVKKIINRVRNEVVDFEYVPGNPVIVFSNTGHNEQNGGSVAECIGFRTQTQGGWGSTASGNNNGTYRDANFSTAFPSGLEVGGDFTLSLNTTQAVQDFLPSGGQSNALSQDYTNPTQSLGAFAGNVVALSLSVGFDECTVCDDFGTNEFSLKDLIFQEGDFAGMTVEDVLAEANRVLGGGAEQSYSINQLNNAIDAVNNNYVDGNPANNPNLLGCAFTE